MPRELEAADIVVTSTGAPHQIVGREELEFVAASRMGRPLVMIDLAVPRDIEPSVRDCPGIALYDMDDLQRAVARNLDAREAEAEEARVLVREEVERFEQLDREPRRGADDLGAAPPRRRGRARRCSTRTSRAGSRSSRPTASAWR